jgi:hypothetical protein
MRLFTGKNLIVTFVNPLINKCKTAYRTDSLYSGTFLLKANGISYRYITEKLGSLEKRLKKQGEKH